MEEVFLTYSSAIKVPLNDIFQEIFRVQIGLQIFFSHIFLYYFNKEIGSEVIHDITATSEGIVANSNILVALFFSSSRQPSESSVSLFL